MNTDHVWGHGIDYKWVWKCFARGHHVLFMNPWGPLAGWSAALRNTADYPGYEEGRKAMRNTAVPARKLNLRATVSHPELATTGACAGDRQQAVFFIGTGRGPCPTESRGRVSFS